MTGLPDLPTGELDGDGRHVHPYVRDRHLDASAPGYTTDEGEVTREQRSYESRLAFHTIEPLLGALTPIGLTYLAQTILHRLHSSALMAEIEAAGLALEDLDPRGELLPFEDLHRSRLDTILEQLDAILLVCPGCGRNHGDGCEDALQPGAYVNAETGDAVSVRRVADSRVFAVAHVDATGRTAERVYDREWFEQRFVPADGVEVLGGPA